MIDYTKDRRKFLKTLGASSASLALVSAPTSAQSKEKLTGVSYDMKTHELLSDAQANVVRTNGGIHGDIKVGDSTFPINVDDSEAIAKKDTATDDRRYKHKLSSEYANNGVRSQIFLLDNSKCLAGYLSVHNSNRRTKFDRVGFCLMEDYQSARNTIGGGN
ncbi:hypothetical protein [Haladaptatus sp. W1]|uniref:hypothetical protein n=1 Tax=Haladaptatus sp. W1 TaxID=1897478 RepID=UPI001112D5EF|nr:hypothetical protein [Haladaptatus sp. W1]